MYPTVKNVAIKPINDEYFKYSNFGNNDSGNIIKNTQIVTIKKFVAINSEKECTLDNEFDIFIPYCVNASVMNCPANIEYKIQIKNGNIINKISLKRANVFPYVLYAKSLKSYTFKCSADITNNIHVMKDTENDNKINKINGTKPTFA
eukprot:781505_1